jgi:hypothetical protein
VNERRHKQEELERLAQSKKWTGASGILHGVLGDGVETHMLEMQQNRARAEDIQSQIRQLDFEINALQSAIGTAVSSATIEFKCPSCGAFRKYSCEGSVAETVKKQGWGFCKTCFAPFKVNTNQKNDKWSFEPLRENPTFHVHSAQLNTDIVYTEPLMPDNVRQNLLFIMTQLEEDKNSGAQAQLEHLYTTYSTQVQNMLLIKGLLKFLSPPFTVVCQRCGISIPRTRIGNCPICKDTGVQKKSSEDPIQILKLRLAKGEISKEEYEDLKKSIES